MSKRHPLDDLKPKPRTTVKRFAADLKARIERAAVCFDQPGQDERVAGMRYVLGIVDAALSDYDVRDPGDPPQAKPQSTPSIYTRHARCISALREYRSYRKPADEHRHSAVSFVRLHTKFEREADAILAEEDAIFEPPQAKPAVVHDSRNLNCPRNCDAWMAPGPHPCHADHNRCDCGATREEKP